jgi:hypothetical protein
MSKADGAGDGMVCYHSDSDTNKIAVSSNQNDKVGDSFDKNLASKIQQGMQGDVAEIENTVEIKDKNTGKLENENTLIIAWKGEKLTGNKDSKLVCTITAPFPCDSAKK